MTKPILLTSSLRAKILDPNQQFDSIITDFAQHVDYFQSFDDWNNMALNNPIKKDTWLRAFAMVLANNNHGENVISYCPDATIYNADKINNTLYQFIDTNVEEFFFEDYGLNAHNLFLEFVIYFGVRLETNIDVMFNKAGNYLLSIGKIPSKIGFAAGLEIYFDYMNRLKVGSSALREIHNYEYQSLKPFLAKKDLEFFSKLLYSANLCRFMNRITAGVPSIKQDMFKANPFGYGPVPNAKYNHVLTNSTHKFSTFDFLGVSYPPYVPNNINEEILMNQTLNPFLKRSDLLAIINNPIDSYSRYLAIFVRDYLPTFFKYNKFSSAKKVCEAKIEKYYFSWSQKPENQDAIRTNINNVILEHVESYEWFVSVDKAFAFDTKDNRTKLSKLVAIDQKAVMALNSHNWERMADAFHSYFCHLFDDKIKQSLEAKIKVSEPKPSLPRQTKIIQVVEVESVQTDSKTQEIFNHTTISTIERPKFVYEPIVNEPILEVTNPKSFKELFPNSLFVFDESVIDFTLLDQTSVRYILELVSNGFEVAQLTATKKCNILHRFVAIALYPDTFLVNGAIIPKGKVKVFQSDLYPYLDGDIEIIVTQKLRMFLRNENNFIRIVSFGNPNYHY
jgi:hypothetical protein